MHIVNTSSSSSSWTTTSELNDHGVIDDEASTRFPLPTADLFINPCGLQRVGLRCAGEKVNSPATKFTRKYRALTACGGGIRYFSSVAELCQSSRLT